MKNTTKALGSCLTLLVALLSTGSVFAQETAADTLNPDAFRFFVEKETKPIRLYCYASLWVNGPEESYRMNDLRTAPRGAATLEYRTFRLECHGLPENGFFIGHANKKGGFMALSGKFQPEELDVAKLYTLTLDGKWHKVVLDVRFKSREEQAEYIQHYDAYQEMPYDNNAVLITDIIAFDTWEVK